MATLTDCNLKKQTKLMQKDINLLGFLYKKCIC